MIGSVDDMEFLAHKICVKRQNLKILDSSKPSMPSSAPRAGRHDINEEILEEVAERLLQNKAVNMTMVLDT